MRADIAMRASFSRRQSQITTATMNPVTNMSPPNIRKAISMPHVLFDVADAESTQRLDVRDDGIELGFAFEHGRRRFDRLVGVRMAQPTQRRETRLNVARRICRASFQPRVGRH